MNTLFILIIGGILVLFIHITRLASNEIFSPSNKIHREIGRDKDLSAHLYEAAHDRVLSMYFAIISHGFLVISIFTAVKKWAIDITSNIFLNLVSNRVAQFSF